MFLSEIEQQISFMQEVSNYYNDGNSVMQSVKNYANSHPEQDVMDTIENMIHGAPFSETLKNAGYNSRVIRIIQMGEISNTLDLCIEKVLNEVIEQKKEYLRQEASGYSTMAEISGHTSQEPASSYSV